MLIEIQFSDFRYNPNFYINFHKSRVSFYVLSQQLRPTPKKKLECKHLVKTIVNNCATVNYGVKECNESLNLQCLSCVDLHYLKKTLLQMCSTLKF